MQASKAALIIIIGKPYLLELTKEFIKSRMPTFPLLDEIKQTVSLNQPLAAIRSERNEAGVEQFIDETFRSVEELRRLGNRQFGRLRKQVKTPVACHRVRWDGCQCHLALLVKGKLGLTSCILLCSVKNAIPKPSLLTPTTG